MTTKFWGIVPAAGVGKRMNADRPKQYLLLNNEQTVIEHTLTRLIKSNVFEKIVVAISDGDPYWDNFAISKHEKIIRAEGGKERADSVLNALAAIQNYANSQDWVLVHDAARPCITSHDIEKLISELCHDEVGGILALSSHDTLKDVDGNQIVGTLNRNKIWRALTPQMFRYGALKTALTLTQGNVEITDEASALEFQGFSPKIIEGRSDNIKITRPEDLALARFYLEQQTKTKET
ncbi:MAG: 2-C-methyl-D-erythritol 4-phosphate cytidylyltransferase [Methylococcales bacterium]|nr:2-C-methyl-D-erythritol 4-phosphate cytidylyltransferase [Methylococcales bacterium]MDD5754118.1 2-C-methyl-D-erythritol 4-phosphate cytidylyltransferase [Methylococcales bacterium]